jgi:steroid delta-isomerase-like uncharacterized protein
MKLSGRSTLNKILFVFLASCFLFSCKQPSNSLSQEDARIIMTKYMETINGANLNLVDEVIATDFELHSPFFPEPLVGIDKYKAFVTTTSITFSDFKATIEEIVVEGNKVWGRFSMSGTNTGPLGGLPATGKSFHISGLAVSHIVDGKIIKDETFWNVLEFYQQLGFTLVPPDEGL